ncbi:hypothetical protein CBER1_06459 [Cercospora berteroae]|uniref:Uncharacterized protein n=1 Tax=Cercospora berteroae TaxID=357750 RepID=A0A2S6BS28_9PEZI|nr:hypothetical protein CBER1_06459 [Cercospora berteroae]
MCQQEEEKNIDQEVAQGSALVASTETRNDEGNRVQDTHIEETATLPIEPELVAHATSEAEDVTDTSEDKHTVTENDVQPEDSLNQQATEGANSDATLTSGSNKAQMPGQENKSRRTSRKKKKVKPLKTSGFYKSDSDEESPDVPPQAVPPQDALPQNFDNEQKTVFVRDYSPEKARAPFDGTVLRAIRATGAPYDFAARLNSFQRIKTHSPGAMRADLFGRKPYQMPNFPSRLNPLWSPHEVIDSSADATPDVPEIEMSTQLESQAAPIKVKTVFEQPRAAPTPKKSKGHRRANAVTDATLMRPSIEMMLWEYRDKYARTYQQLQYCDVRLQEKQIQLQQAQKKLQQAKREADDMNAIMAEVQGEVEETCAQLRVNRDKYEDQIELLQRKLDESRADVERIGQDRDEVRTSLLALQTSLEQRTAALEAATVHSKEMQTQIEAGEESLKVLEARNDHLQAQLDGLLARDRDLDQKTAKLQSHLRQLSRQLDGTHDMIEKLQTQNADLERSNRILERQVALRRISEARSEPWNKRRKAWREEYAWIEEHKILKQRAQQEDLARADYESAREYALDDLKLPESNDAFEFYQKLAGRVVRVPKSAAKSAAQESTTRKPTWLSIWRSSVSQSFSWYW